ncbi:unnamed protein product [Pedinophyceae sp. YPF-701]|nr:unnamed protein product [Pedinophyceae sp. YPF-701]
MASHTHVCRLFRPQGYTCLGATSPSRPLTAPGARYGALPAQGRRTLTRRHALTGPRAAQVEAEVSVTAPPPAPRTANGGAPRPRSLPWQRAGSPARKLSPAGRKDAPAPARKQPPGPPDVAAPRFVQRRLSVTPMRPQRPQVQQQGPKDGAQDRHRLDEQELEKRENLKQALEKLRGAGGRIGLGSGAAEGVRVNRPANGHDRRKKKPPAHAKRSVAATHTGGKPRPAAVRQRAHKHARPAAPDDVELSEMLSSTRSWKRAAEYLAMSAEGRLMGPEEWRALKALHGLEEEWRPAVSMLWREGFDEKDLEKLLESRPQLFSFRASLLKSRLGHLRSDLGLTADEARRAVLKFPRILEYRPAHTIEPRLRFLEAQGVSAGGFVKILLRAPQVLELSVENTLAPRVQYLRDLGLTRAQLGKVLARDPVVLTYTVESMQNRVDFLRGGVGLTEAQVAETIHKHAQVLHYRVNAMDSRRQFLSALGLSSADVAAVATRLPQIFSLDIESNLRPKVEYITGAMGCSLDIIVAFPGILSLSLVQRIVPRHRYLRKRGIELPSKLSTFGNWLKCTDKQFAAKAGGTFEEFMAFRNAVVAEQLSSQL